MRHLYSLLLLFFAVSAQARNVMSWVPPYSIQTSYNLLNTGSPANIENGLTHLGLQWWVPDGTGGITFITDYQYTSLGDLSDEVEMFVDWGDANDVETMLCLFNIHDDDFDWDIAISAFGQYQDESVASIIAEVEKYNLDGVDIDFEGGGDQSLDMSDFAEFLYKLNNELKKNGKTLSVDVFPSPCYNAPNVNWIPNLAPYCDFVNVMGYDETYEGNSASFYCSQNSDYSHQAVLQYSFIKSFLDKNDIDDFKVNYGVPGWMEYWGEPSENSQTILGHMADIENLTDGAGMAIWDIALMNGGTWRESTTWDKIEEFKATPTLSVEDGEEDNHPIAYNPASEQIMIEGKNGTLALVSVDGRVLQQTKDNTMDLNAQNPGIYIVQFTSTNQEQFSRTVVKY